MNVPPCLLCGRPSRAAAVPDWEERLTLCPTCLDLDVWTFVAHAEGQANALRERADLLSRRAQALRRNPTAWAGRSAGR